MSNTSEQILDVAIVGAGAAGAYCAYRLSTAYPNKQIALFEGSERIGGRLLSVQATGMEELVCELGGMFFPSIHHHVLHTAQHLGLQADPVKHGVRRHTLLRGRSIAPTQLSDSRQVPYNLDPEEQQYPAHGLIGLALKRLFPQLANLNAPEVLELLDTLTLDGKPLQNWGFWNLLARGLSNEAYSYARDGNPDDYMVHNWNAADMIRQHYQFMAATGAYQLRAGYDQIPIELSKRFVDTGGNIGLRTRLIGFDTVTLPDQTRGVRLDLHAHSDGWGSSGSGTPRTVYARSLVLAMPRRALELLDQRGALLSPANPEFPALLRSVTPLPMFKLFLAYEQPWWKELGITHGHSLTDLPARVCYYWGIDQPSGRGLLMASLSSLSSIDFWRGLVDRQGALPANPVSTRAAMARWADYATPAHGAIVEEIQRQLALLHQLEQIDPPYAAVYSDWGSDPYGGAGNFWNIHVNSAELSKRMRKPQPDLPIYICGEAYSQVQGWVEGALESAELLLQEHFGLARASWL